MSQLAWIGAVPLRLQEHLRRYRPNGTRANTATLLNGGYPAPYPGRVIDVGRPDSATSAATSAVAVREMVDAGLRALAERGAAADAWRCFFEPGDVVGIKVSPVGHPLAMTSFALVDAVVAGLRGAGVAARDIIVFDRFRRDLRAAGYLRRLPPGVRWAAPAWNWDPVQLDMAGYDPDVFCEVPIDNPRAPDPRAPRARRSHLCLVASRYANKIINLPVLKDHRTAGITAALKNLSHGLVNNVERSHWRVDHNTCGQFIPAVCAMPAIRRTVVLHILDGLQAVFEGGPTARADYVWPHGRLYFATDPVAMDRIALTVIDAKRTAMGLPPVAESAAALHGDSPDSAGPLRQPQYIERAGALGLGVADRAAIDLRHVRLAG